MLTLAPVRNVKDAQFAHCLTCGTLEPCPYWGPSKTKGLHERGTGHKVILVAFQEGEINPS